MRFFYRLVASFVVVFFCSSVVWAQSNLIITGPASITPGSTNVIVNPGWVNAGLTGLNNTAIGHWSGNQLTSGLSNTFIGKSAGQNTTSGFSNNFFGYLAGNANRDGFSNTMIGNLSGWQNNGNNNVFVGTSTGLNSLSANNNTFIGNFSGFNNTNGSTNAYLGIAAGRTNQIGSYNVMLGDSSGYNNTVSNNLFVGSKSGYTNQTGQQNTFLGFQSGYNAVADSNTFVGYKSGYSATTGKGNTFFGSLSGQGVSTGSHNTIMGNGAGPTNGNGDSNIYIGYTTGKNDDGSRNTFLGTGADALAKNLTNATAIGAGASVSVSDAVVLGNEANVGIGTTAPTARLHVRSERADESGVRLEHLTSNSPALAKSDKVLSVNEQGEVILVQPITNKLLVYSKADWADRVFEPGYTLQSLDEVNQYVTKNKHLPNVPSAEEVVRNGYNAATMDARLLEKVEETMLYVIQLKAEINQLRQQNQQLKRAVSRLKKH